MTQSSRLIESVDGSNNRALSKVTAAESEIEM